jgi:signal transduction histidine kinase
MNVSDRRKRQTAGAAVSAVGVVLLGVPAYDVWDDLTNLQGWSVGSTLLENSIPALFALLLVVGGIWLARRDWQPTYAFDVAKWTLGGMAIAAALFTWIVLMQLWVMGGLKPYVLAMEGVLIGGLASFVGGVYYAQREKSRDRMVYENTRMSALFSNTSDYIATARVGDDIDIDEINDTFRRSDRDPEALCLAAVEAADLDGLQSVLWHAQEDQIISTRYTTAEGREYLARIVPLSDGDGIAEVFFVFTDITEQTRLAREVAAKERIEYLHAVVSELAGVDEAGEAYDLAIDAVEDAIDADAVVLAEDGVPARTRGTNELLDPAAADRADNAVDVVGAGGRAIRNDTEDGEVLTVRAGARVVIQTLLTDGEFDESEVTALELLATHLRGTLDRLQRQRTLAEEHERLQFMNRVVRHDLLDGMNVLVTQLQLLEGHVDEERQERLDTLRGRVDDMVDLLETMRTFMKTVVGDSEREFGPVSLADTVDHQVGKLREEHPEATVEVDVPDLTVRADDLLSEVIRNLLSNAVEHGREEAPTIRVTAEADERTVSLSVGDDGPGIPPDQRATVFEQGERGPRSSGTGIGLYLVEQLVTDYGGSVEVGESDLGGARFCLRFPRITETR